jgi:hypothetical protein
MYQKKFAGIQIPQQVEWANVKKLFSSDFFEKITIYAVFYAEFNGALGFSKLASK